MVNGLFGAPENWNIVIEELQGQIDSSDVLLVASNVLGRTRVLVYAYTKSFLGTKHMNEVLAQEPLQWGEAVEF